MRGLLDEWVKHLMDNINARMIERRNDEHRNQMNGRMAEWINKKIHETVKEGRQAGRQERLKGEK